MRTAGFGRGGGDRDRDNYRGGPPREGFGRGRPAGDDKVTDQMISHTFLNIQNTAVVLLMSVLMSVLHSICVFS